MSIRPGDFVIATSGRDMGKCFIVLSVENQFLYLCDGKNRKVSTPKKKKAKHVSIAGAANDSIRGRLLDGGITNREVRRAISIFKGLTAESY